MGQRLILTGRNHDRLRSHMRPVETKLVRIEKIRKRNMRIWAVVAHLRTSARPTHQAAYGYNYFVPII